jgi:hypothetical protein
MELWSWTCTDVDSESAISRRVGHATTVLGRAAPAKCVPFSELHASTC